MHLSRKVVFFSLAGALVVAGLGIAIIIQLAVREKPGGEQMTPVMNTEPLPVPTATEPLPTPTATESLPTPTATEPLPTSTRTPPPPAVPLEIRGVDLSSLPQVEDHGGIFTDEGEARDIFQILSDHGVNAVRLKLWHTPANGYNDLEHVKGMATRSKQAGMGFMLDIHYSDTWADPKHQTKPAAWQDLDYEQLKTAVHDYTRDALTALRAQGTDPDIVQIGNEITPGFLWDDGKLDDSDDAFARLAGLLKAGIAGVKDSGSGARIMLHLDRGGDNAACRWWFDGVLAEGVEFDLIGLSFYGYWHGDLADLSANLADLAQRYGKELIVVETAYAYTLSNQDGYGNIISSSSQLLPGYPASEEGQAAWVRDLMQTVATAPGGLSQGVFYWEPAWLGLRGCGWDPTDDRSGNAWENQALFGFDGRALPALAVFKEFAAD